MRRYFGQKCSSPKTFKRKYLSPISFLDQQKLGKIKFFKKKIGLDKTQSNKFSQKWIYPKERLPGRKLIQYFFGDLD